nr:ribonuclease H-like domain-containing protein [Tanacetum cinerariifolium]
MEYYLCHTDYPIWQVIQNGNGLVSVTTCTNGMIKVLPPKTAEEVMARDRERKVRTTLLMALPEDHLAKFHKMTDANEMWEVIKSRFDGNDESKKMQKYLLKQQFKGFSVSASKGLHKGYDRFQTLLGLDTLSFDDLYNNLRVFELDVKGTTASSTTTQNMVFVPGESTSSTNNVFTAYSVSSLSVSKLQQEGSSSYTNEVAMIFMRIKKFHKRTGRKMQFDTKDPVGFDKTKVECFNCHKMGHFARDCRAKGNQDSRRRDVRYNGNKARDTDRIPAYQDDSKALVTIDGLDIDWFGHVEEDTKNYAMMAYSNLSSDNESVFRNKECDLENAPVNDRYFEGMHVVPPHMIGNYMPSRPDVEIDYSKFTYGPKQNLVDESDAKTSENATCESDTSVETTTFMPAIVEDAPKVVSEPKVWTDAPIIEEYESDSDDDSVSNVSEEKEKPSFAFTDTVKHVKTSRENVKDTGTPTHYPKVEKHGNKAHLADYQEFKGGSVTFGGSNGKITGKGKNKGWQNKVLFTDIDCLMLSLDFELPDENQ